jgi:nucleoside 2-deoxyribosyltransferase
MNRAKGRRPSLNIFLIHSDTEQVPARKLRNLLADRLGSRVFSTDDISAGEELHSRLRQELARADVIVALLTPSTARSNWVLLEVGAAWALEKPIIPVVTNRSVLNYLPESLQGPQVLEISDLEQPEALDRIVQAIESVIAAHR